MPAQVLHQNEKVPASDFLGWMATLINTCFGLAGSAMTTTVAAATDIADLRARIEALVPAAAHRQNEGFFRELSNLLQVAYNRGTIDNTDIAAFTTINTVDASTDLLYQTVRRYNSVDYDNTYYGRWTPMVVQP